KELAGIEGDDGTAFVLAHALLLNGRGTDAIAVLKDRAKSQAELVFDMLCAQLKFQEAFAFADQAAKEFAKDDDIADRRDALDLQRAKVLAALGNRDAATQLFRSVMDRALGGDRFRIGDETSIDVVKAAVRAGMRDLAAECAARAVARYDSSGISGVMARYLDPFLGEQKYAAQIWWYAYREDKPAEQPIAAMTRI